MRLKKYESTGSLLKTDNNQEAKVIKVLDSDFITVEAMLDAGIPNFPKTLGEVIISKYSIINNTDITAPKNQVNNDNDILASNYTVDELEKMLNFKRREYSAIQNITKSLQELVDIGADKIYIIDKITTIVQDIVKGGKNYNYSSRYR